LWCCRVWPSGFSFFFKTSTPSKVSNGDFDAQDFTTATTLTAFLPPNYVVMAEISIVFFLFEMSIHLDFKTLMIMRRDVFGLSGSQFMVTEVVVAPIAAGLCGLSSAAQTIWVEV
jgi:hypothetical protein